LTVIQGKKQFSMLKNNGRFV